MGCYRNNVAVLRKERGWTQDQLARLSELSISTIRHVEQCGDSIIKCRLATLLPIARALGVPIERLYTAT